MEATNSAKICEEDVVIPTYEIGAPDKNPMFLEKRVYQGSSGKVYSYPTTEKISHEKKDKIWHAVYLENEYLKVMILPELGGRIQRAYFTLYPGKARDRNLTDEVAVYRTDDRCIHRKSAGFQLVKTI